MGMSCVGAFPIYMSYMGVFTIDMYGCVPNGHVLYGCVSSGHVLYVCVPYVFHVLSRCVHWVWQYVVMCPLDTVFMLFAGLAPVRFAIYLLLTLQKHMYLLYSL